LRTAYDVGEHALRPAKHRNYEDCSTVVIAAGKRDLAPIRRPGREIEIAAAGMGEPQRLVAANQLHIEVAPAGVLAIPEERDLPGIR